MPGRETQRFRHMTIYGLSGNAALIHDGTEREAARQASWSRKKSSVQARRHLEDIFGGGVLDIALEEAWG